jgi:hypothetical protein
MTSANSDPQPAESDIRTRLRLLIGGRVLPRIEPKQVWAGPCSDSHACTACGSAISVGETEFEMTGPGEVVIFLHRRCFDLWTCEAVEASGEARP